MLRHKRFTAEGSTSTYGVVLTYNVGIFNVINVMLRKLKMLPLQYRSQVSLLSPNYRYASVSVRTHSHALATRFPVWHRPSEPIRALRRAGRTPTCTSRFLYLFQIRTDSDGSPLGCDWSANEIIS